MKKLIFASVAILSAMFAFSSCNDEIDFDNSTFFNTESFSDFLWKKQGPVKIESEIEFDFEECDGLTKPLVLCLCDDGGEKIGADIAQLFVNDEIQPDNTIKIYPNSDENDVDIEIVLNPELTDKDRVFTWNLKVVNKGSVQKVNDTEAGADGWVDGTTIQWKNNHIANPLATMMKLTGLALLIILAVLYLIMHLFVNRSTSFTKVYIKYPGEVYDTEIKLRGACRLVCCNEAMKRSALLNFFVGKVVYEQNPFWESPHTIKSGSRKNYVVIKGPYPTNGDMERNEIITVTNDQNQQATITTN